MKPHETNVQRKLYSMLYVHSSRLGDLKRLHVMCKLRSLVNLKLFTKCRQVYMCMLVHWSKSYLLLIFYIL